MPYIPPIPEGSIRVNATDDVEDIEKRVSARFLEELGKLGQREIRRLMVGGGMLKNSSGRLPESVQYRIEDGGVVWFSDAPNAKVIEKGMQPRRMTELIGKTVPVIVRSGGKRIYRKVTLRSIMMGKWSHPGFPGKDFFARGVRITMQQAARLWAESRHAVMMVM